VSGGNKDAWPFISKEKGIKNQYKIDTEPPNSGRLEDRVQQQRGGTVTLNYIVKEQ
jgi:hypothetical protein